MSTHGEYTSNGGILFQDERTPVPERQSIAQIDYQVGESHGNVRRHRLLYSHVLSILQVLLVSVVQHTDTNMSASSMKGQVRVKHRLDYNDNWSLWHR